MKYKYIPVSETYTKPSSMKNTRHPGRLSSSQKTRDHDNGQRVMLDGSIKHQGKPKSERLNSRRDATNHKDKHKQLLAGG